MNENKVRKYLDVIERAVQLIRTELNSTGSPEELLKAIDSEPIVPVNPVSPPPKSMEPSVAVPSDYEEQRKTHVEALMSIDCWPQAVHNYLLTSPMNKESKINRSNAVLDTMLDRSIEKLEFLDFGCGDGWEARQALMRGAANVTGYDIQESLDWKEIDKVNFTTKFSDLKPNHYDVILLYDVLDHCQDPIEVMRQVKGLLKFGGKSVVFVRCHPWTSRHATHLYKQGINKAYIHLFLTDEEISDVIKRTPALIEWANSILTYANEKAISEGKHWPGFKLVEGTSRRKWIDEDSATQAILDKLPELSEDDIFNMKLKPITQIEKTVGKKRFNEILSDVVVKPQGKPILVPEEDKRPALGVSQAQLDFKE